VTIQQYRVENQDRHNELELAELDEESKTAFTADLGSAIFRSPISVRLARVHGIPCVPTRVNRCRGVIAQRASGCHETKYR